MTRHLLPTAFAVASIVAAASATAQVTTFIVTSSADDVNAPDANPGDGTCADANGDCTLRAAVDEANATSGEVVIVLPGRLPGGNTGTYTLSLVAPNTAANTFEDDNAFGDLDIGGAFSTLTIQGTGTPGPQVTISPNDRIFDIKSGTVNIERVWITGGTANAGANGTSDSPDATDGADGGGIRVQSGATLNLDQVTVSGCFTQSGGNGGVPASSSERTTGGDAGDGGDGGGIYIASGATVSITRSNIAGNGTGDAGGAGSGQGDSAMGGAGGDGGNGGGIYNAGTLTVTSSTIFNNTQGSPSGGGAGVNGGMDGADGAGGSGGGIANAQEVDGTLTDQGTATLTNTIVAGNTAGDLLSNGKAPGDDLFDASGGGTFTDGGNNLIGSNESVASTFPQGTLVGTDASPVDPVITGQNSGSDWAVPTLVLGSGSPAIDAGATTVSSDFDARGFLRPDASGSSADIGAYEANSSDAPIEVSLNEIDVNTTDPNQEFVEFTNTGDYPVQADDLVLVGFDGSGTATTSCLTANLYGEIAPGGLFTVGDADISPKDQVLDLDIAGGSVCGSGDNQFVDSDGAVAIYRGGASSFTGFEAGTKSADRLDVIVYTDGNGGPSETSGRSGTSNRGAAADLCGAFGLGGGCAATDPGDNASIQSDGNGGLTTAAPSPGAANAGAAVPVTWMAIEAFAKTRNTATVKWRTAAEVDNAGFGVERLDGDVWTEVASVESLGSGGGEYAVEVGGLTTGEHVFRIRQDDYDGLRNYSPAVTVRLVGGAAQVYPNPARDIAYIKSEGDHAAPVDIEVTDELGRSIARLAFEATAGASVFELPVASLPAGNYFLRVTRAGAVETLRLERR